MQANHKSVLTGTIATLIAFSIIDVILLIVGWLFLILGWALYPGGKDFLFVLYLPAIAVFYLILCFIHEGVGLHGTLYDRAGLLKGYYISGIIKSVIDIVAFITLAVLFREAFLSLFALLWVWKAIEIALLIVSTVYARLAYTSIEAGISTDDAAELEDLTPSSYHQSPAVVHQQMPVNYVAYSFQQPVQMGSPQMPLTATYIPLRTTV